MTAPLEADAHGATRHHHVEHCEGEITEFLDSTTGEVLFRGPSVILTQTAKEKWCAGCQAWFRVAGILGDFAWLADHETHAPLYEEHQVISSPVPSVSHGDDQGTKR